MSYVVAKDYSEAIALLSAEGRSCILAGGTDLLVQMKLNESPMKLLVDIKRIDGASSIHQEDGGFRIGAAVSGAEMGEHSELRTLWPGVVEAVELIGSTQIQGRATMAGNLCNGSPAADSVPALLAAKAVVRIEGPDGSRDENITDILKGPGETTLGKADIVTSIFLPSRPAHSADAYLRFIPRTEMDIAVASAGVSLSLDDSGTVINARVALGAVSKTAVLVAQAADALLGSRLEAAALEACAAACAAACSPIDDKRGTVEFRTKIAGVMATRAAKLAYQRAGGQL